MMQNQMVDRLSSDANALFQRLLNTSRSYSSILGKVLGWENKILDIDILLDLVPVTSTSSGKITDIHVDKIIGTEDKSQDFTSNFFPLHSWMAKRWTKIYKLMHSEGISEPVKLIEYGGYYFVRDGNHRVSVAKNSGIEYLTAEIIHYKIPFKLPKNLNYKNLDLLTEKYQFHKRTKLFNIIHDDIFIVNSPKTWKKLEIEIFEKSRSWFIRYFGRKPENAVEFIMIWMKFYKISIEHIHQNSLLLLFPGMCETDVFIEIVEFWNSHEDPDSLWVGEIYEKFEKYIQKRKVFLRINHILNKWFRKLSATSEDEKKFFLNTTNIKMTIPDITIPIAGKKFFTLCYKQIFLIYANLWMKEKNKQPDPTDINNCWYKTFYKPVLERYQNRLYQFSFEHFYNLFSRYYYHKIIYGNALIEKCFEEFEKKIVK